MIQATCNTGYASAYANYELCNNGVFQFQISTAEHNASYTVKKAKGTPYSAEVLPYVINKNIQI